MLRAVCLTVLLTFVAACTNSNDLDQAAVPLGDFALGYNVVVAPNMVKGPVSREATKEQWIASLTKSIDDRFSRYDGPKLYHFGVSVEGYVLAEPGIPLVFSPKSALILNLTVWDDAAGKKLNPEPQQVTVLESLSGETMVGSGLTQSAEQQMENLSKNAAKLIQNYLVKMMREEKWFKGAVPPEAPAKADTSAKKTKEASGTQAQAGTAAAPAQTAAPSDAQSKDEAKTVRDAERAAKAVERKAAAEEKAAKLKAEREARATARLEAAAERKRLQEEAAAARKAVNDAKLAPAQTPAVPAATPPASSGINLPDETIIEADVIPHAAE